MSGGPIEIRILDRIAAIPEATWDALDGARTPFLRWRWLDALEKTGCVGGRTAWRPAHLALHEDGRLVAACPAYLKSNSEGEFVFDHGWAGAAQRAGIRYYPKLLVAVPFTPATATRLLVADASDRPRLLPVMAAALAKVTDELGVSGAHVLFPPEAEAVALEQAGLAHRVGVQFHWSNAGYATFDDFLARFDSKRRHQIRRERRDVAKAGVTVETLTGGDLGPEIVDAMFRFYCVTVDKFYWGRRYLNRAFFEEVAASVPGIEVVIARSASRKIVAGAFNLASSDALFGRYWGAEADVPFLHFEVCFYHSIERAIARGLGRFEPGAGGEHKLARGFAPTATHSVHLIADPRLDAAIRDHLVREREVVAEGILSESPFVR